MPYRKIPIATGEFYHVFNRSVAKLPIFINKNDYQRGLALIEYYRHKNPPYRFSHYKNLSVEQRLLLRQTHPSFSNPLVNIVAYCIMPNHFHFLLQPILENGVSDFMRNFQHSYAKYHDTKYERTGSVMQSMFHAVRIETSEQLLHVSRYIHLNPVTAYIAKPENLADYAWSSFPSYMSEQQSFVDTQAILSSFPSKSAYMKFVLDQVDYQRSLAVIQHLSLEE